jgi:DNA-binding response OmpR family regulator
LNILIIHDDPQVVEEIREYLTLPDSNFYFTTSTMDAIRKLNVGSIDLVVLNISNMKDAGILKYINDNFKDLEVMILASREYDEIISTFLQGRFHIVKQQQKMAELKSQIEELIMHKK